MPYAVLRSFTDTDDKSLHRAPTVYWAGKDTYPREGYTPSEERIKQLQGDNNHFKAPVISDKPIATPPPKQETKK